MTEKENSFKNRLQTALKLKNITQAELSRKSGIDTGSISHYLKGTYKPKQKKTELLAKALNVNVIWLMGGDVSMGLKASTTTPINYNKTNMIKMPVLGRIPAGVPFDAIEDIDTYLYIHKDRIKKTPEDYFLLKIDGDSMSPKYENEDIILFEKSSTADNGQDVAIMVNNYDATFKTFYKYKDRIELKPINQQYQVKIYSNDEIEKLSIAILGIAKSLEYRDLS